jgi:hypothetical protein
MMDARGGLHDHAQEKNRILTTRRKRYLFEMKDDHDLRNMFGNTLHR